MTIIDRGPWTERGDDPMALRHAVLTALLDEELSGYQLAKVFDLGVANFWHALPQQLYAELAKLEKEGLAAGREVVQDTRPNKRLFRVSDDLLVIIQAADHLDPEVVVAQLTERAAFAEAKIELFGALLRKMRGDRGEDDFLRHGERIGPYLTCRRGLDFEQANLDWCRRTTTILRERSAASGKC